MISLVLLPGYTEDLERTLSKRFRKLVYLVDDDSVLDPALDTVNSQKVRRNMAGGKDVAGYVGAAVAGYMAANGVVEKASGGAPWSPEDKAPTVGV